MFSTKKKKKKAEEEKKEKSHFIIALYVRCDIYYMVSIPNSLNIHVCI